MAEPVGLVASDAEAPAEGDADGALMLAYASGDAGAFDRLYAKHRGPLYRYVLRQVRDAGVAEELFQDVWMSAIRARAGYVPTARFTAWLYTLARHRVIDHWRAAGTLRMETLDGDGPEDDAVGRAVDAVPGSRTDEPDTRVDARRIGDRIHAAVSALPPQQREAFVLHVESGLPLAEIARITGDGMETIKSRVRYAFAKLRATLGDLA